MKECRKFFFQSGQPGSLRMGLLTAAIGIMLSWANTGWSAAFDLVREGKPAAVIIIPEKAFNVVERAAEELQYYVKEASGATLEIIRENVKTQNGLGSLYLGPCQATGQAGIAPDKLSRNGFIIKTVGTDLFIVGHDMEGPWFAHDYIESGTLLGVYNFLDRQMGIRWLWPGKLGELIPKAATISVGVLDQTTAMPLLSSRFHPSFRANVRGWSGEAMRKQFEDDETLWEHHHYFSWYTPLRSDHSFEDYWDRFHESHPDFFNMLPDGTRRPDPYHVCKGAAGYVAMCVSNPELWQQIIEDWKANRTPANPHIHIGENDTNGSCCCPRCLSWDVPDPELQIPWEQRLEYAKKSFAAGEGKWNTYLGSMSDRYAKFYMAVLNLARQIDPDVLVQGFAYANYKNPPLQAKLDDHIVIHFVGPLMYPWTAEKVQAFKNDWTGWANTGARMILRPNFMLDGHNMPIYFAHKYADLISFCYQHGMLGTEFDSNIGQYSTQGPNMYVMARMHFAIDKPLDEILDEYYSAFGSAEPAVRQYFALWQRVSDAVTDEDCKKAEGHGLGVEIGGWNKFFWVAGQIFTPQLLAQGREILSQAAQDAKEEPLSLARVEYLQKGLKNAELTIATQQAFEQYQNDKNEVKFAQAVQTLDDYRVSVESENIGNMAYLTWAEDGSWGRSLLKFLGKPGEKLPDTWKFSWDPKKQGQDNQWFAEKFDDSSWSPIGIDSAWEDQPIGKQWEKEHGSGYNGLAWYRNTFTVAPSDKPRKIILGFGAVDEACKIWLNGQFILDRPFPYKGDGESWQQPFEIDITAQVRDNQPNILAVCVEDNTGAGGIWRPVKLIMTEAAK